ncbi:GAF and ANTAR domain-containing protein [Brachybacterium phenoliresistens]|nr:GAF and ANTAR domain-containing protein [Brachybacterium phenoliresistens]
MPSPTPPAPEKERPMSAPEQTRDAMTSMERLLLESEDIAGFLEEFIEHLAQRLSTGDEPVWCGVSLRRQRRSTTVVTSGPHALEIDALQYASPDGPCLTAMREQTVIRVGDVREDGRWPQFHSAADQQGVRSVLAVPFALRGEAQAALNIYSSSPHDFDPRKIEVIQLEVDRASSGLLLAIRLADGRDAEEDLRASMQSRTTIDLATGIIMAQNRCTQQEALEILTAASNHRNEKLRDVALALVVSLNGGPPTHGFVR